MPSEENGSLCNISTTCKYIQNKVSCGCRETKKLSYNSTGFSDSWSLFFPWVIPLLHGLSFRSSNMALQRFGDLDRAMAAIFNSLKRSGRMGLACPATPDWSLWFGRIISKVAENSKIKPTFSHWKNPWFHLPTENDYRLFFEKHGFVTIFIDIDHEQTDYSMEEAFDIYLSGAANGSTGKKYYDIEIGDDYIAAFNNSVKEEIERQSKEGRIMVDFNRLYYIGRK